MKTNKTNNNGGDRIIRHRAKGYLSLPGDILFDRDVSIKERGIYMTIMALPINEDDPDDGWKLSIKGLSHILPDGRDAIAAALKGLQQKGWVTHLPIRDDKGRMKGTAWHLYDQKLSYFRKEQNPQTENPVMEPETDFPDTGKPNTENPEPENPTQFKIPLDLNTNNLTHTHTADGSPSVEEEKKHSDVEQRVIDRVQGFIHDECADLELRFKPLTDEQVLYLRFKLDIDIPNLAKYLKDIQAKQLNYMVGASLCRLVEKFREYDFTRRKKK